MRVEHVDDLGEIGERTRQPARTLYTTTICTFGRFDVAEQPLKRRSLHRAARQPSVVIQVWERRPPACFWLQDVGSASLPLRVERVELLLEPFVGGLARVDRAIQ